MTAATLSRPTVINLRAPAFRRDEIDRAARVQGKSRTEFMLDAASEKAQQVLLDRTDFTLSAAQYRRFVELLDAPLANPKAVKRLLSRKAPWDK